MKEGGNRPQQINQPEQGKSQQESGEPQPLPGVWAILERKARLRAPESPPMTTAEYFSELREVNRLQEELEAEATDRDRLILGLYNAVTIQPGAGGPVIRRLSLEEFQQFRSRVEPLADEELAEAIRQQKEENERTGKELYRKPPWPFLALP
jgi:hypothetical protein